MRGQFGVQPGTEAPKAMRVVLLNRELLAQLTVDGFDDLAEAFDQVGQRGRQLDVLIGAAQGNQSHALFLELSGQRGLHIALVA